MMSASVPVDTLIAAIEAAAAEAIEQLKTVSEKAAKPALKSKKKAKQKSERFTVIVSDATGAQAQIHFEVADRVPEVPLTTAKGEVNDTLAAAWIATRRRGEWRMEAAIQEAKFCAVNNTATPRKTRPEASRIRLANVRADLVENTRVCRLFRRSCSIRQAMRHLPVAHSTFRAGDYATPFGFAVRAGLNVADALTQNPVQ